MLRPRSRGKTSINAKVAKVAKVAKDGRSGGLLFPLKRPLLARAENTVNAEGAEVRRGTVTDLEGGLGEGPSRRATQS